MVKDMYGDLLDGNDSSGFDTTEILGDLLDGDDESGEFVGDDESGEDILGALLHKKKTNAKKQAMAALVPGCWAD